MYPPVKDEKKPSLTKKLYAVEQQWRSYRKDDRVGSRNRHLPNKSGKIKSKVKGKIKTKKL